MENDKLEWMLGEWRGEGETTIEGLPQMRIVEFIRLSHTDNPEMLSYIRRSRIENPRGPAEQPRLHDELGYMGTKVARLLLSRGSYVLLDWTGSRYEQPAQPPPDDTKEMFREVSFPAYDQMRWLNGMMILVSHGGPAQWLKHTVDVTFTIQRP